LADLYAKLAALEGRIKGQEEEADKKKMREDVAAIQAIMNGEDALSHKIKFLVDIPKWQQFKVIGSTDSSFEEAAQGIHRDLYKNDVEEFNARKEEIKQNVKAGLDALSKKLAELKAAGSDKAQSALLLSQVLALLDTETKTAKEGSRKDAQLDDKLQNVTASANSGPGPEKPETTGAPDPVALKKAADNAIAKLENSANSTDKKTIKAAGEDLNAAADAIGAIKPVDKQLTDKLLAAANKLIALAATTTVLPIPPTTLPDAIILEAKKLVEAIKGLPITGGASIEQMGGIDPMAEGSTDAPAFGKVDVKTNVKVIDMIGPLKDLILSARGDPTKRTELGVKVKEATTLYDSVKTKQPDNTNVKLLGQEIEIGNIVAALPDEGTKAPGKDGPGKGDENPAPVVTPGADGDKPAPTATPGPESTNTPAGATGATGGPAPTGEGVTPATTEPPAPKGDGDGDGDKEKTTPAPSGEGVTPATTEPPAPKGDAPPGDAPKGDAPKGGSKHKRSRHNKKGRKSTRTKRHHGRNGKKMTKKK